MFLLLYFIEYFKIHIMNEEEEKSLKILRMQRETYKDLYGTELDRINKKREAVINSIHENRQAVLSFIVESRRKIDAEDFIAELKKINNIKTKLLKKNDQYQIKGEFTDLTTLELTQEVYFEIIE